MASRKHRHSHRCLEVHGNLIWCNVKQDWVEVEGSTRQTPLVDPYIVTFIDRYGQTLLFHAPTLENAEGLAEMALNGGAKQVSVIDRAAGAIQTYSRNPGKKPWTKLPKGWTEASLQSMAEKLLTGPHPISKCVEKIGPHVQTPEAFCATLARRTGRDRR